MQRRGAWTGRCRWGLVRGARAASPPTPAPSAPSAVPPLTLPPSPLPPVTTCPPAAPSDIPGAYQEWKGRQGKPLLVGVCPNGGQSLGSCINGLCGLGFTCVSNQCCPGSTNPVNPTLPPVASLQPPSQFPFAHLSDANALSLPSRREQPGRVHQRPVRIRGGVPERRVLPGHEREHGGLPQRRRLPGRLHQRPLRHRLRLRQQPVLPLRQPRPQPRRGPPATAQLRPHRRSQYAQMFTPEEGCPNGVL